MFWISGKVLLAFLVSGSSSSSSRWRSGRRGGNFAPAAAAAAASSDGIRRTISRGSPPSSGSPPSWGFRRRRRRFRWAAGTGGTIGNNDAAAISCRGGASSATSSAPKGSGGGDRDDAVEEFEDVDGFFGDGDDAEEEEEDAYILLAKAVRGHIHQHPDERGQPPPPPTTEKLVRAFQMMSSTQKAFKGLDGAAHEAYQRTHSGGDGSGKGGGEDDDDKMIKVSGRARRSLARAGATADGLGACELCELLEFPERFRGSSEDDRGDGDDDDEVCDSSSPSPSYLFAENGTLAGKEVLLNATDAVKIDGGGDDDADADTYLSVLVLYDPSYRGGAGANHGGVAFLSPGEGGSGNQDPGSAKGRLVVVLADRASRKLDRTVRLLVQNPVHVRLKQGSLATSESASVQPMLYGAAGSVLRLVEPHLRSHAAAGGGGGENATATSSSAVPIHFVGHSLSGGVAALAAAILEGRLPMPGEKKKKTQKKQTKKKQKSRKKAKQTTTSNPEITSDDKVLSNSTGSDESANATVADTVVPLQGLGKGRVSAVTIGAPPCLSGNVQADFITSILYGDDIVCRTTEEGLDRFFGRARRALKSSGFGLRQVNWMTDTISLAASNLKSHAHGSEGEEARLSVPGRAYLVRPRRLGHSCSMHEVGSQLKGGREALRAAVLWQLNDVLLSRSMWRHHQLESYIHGLDRVHLRGFEGGEEGEEENDEEDDESNELY